MDAPSRSRSPSEREEKRRATRKVFCLYPPLLFDKRLPRLPFSASNGTPSTRRASRTRHSTATRGRDGDDARGPCGAPLDARPRSSRASPSGFAARPREASGTTPPETCSTSARRSGRTRAHGSRRRPPQPREGITARTKRSSPGASTAGASDGYASSRPHRLRRPRPLPNPRRLPRSSKERFSGSRPPRLSRRRPVPGRTRRPARARARARRASSRARRCRRRRPGARREPRRVCVSDAAATTERSSKTTTLP